ncbi:MAG: tetratricopeptide repeat protein [Verrucomicrobiota bacterium]|nr:tetratricopeptide repeat protein [Verrucomicrobiota bacterium]
MYFSIRVSSLALLLSLASIVADTETHLHAENFAEMSLVELGQNADNFYASNPVKAIPYMVEIRQRLVNAMSEEFRSIYRENLYRLGIAFMRCFQETGNREQLKLGIPYWDEFIHDFISDERHRLAMLNRADSYYGAENWLAAISNYQHVLQLYTEQLEVDDLLIVLERLLAAATNLNDVESILSTLRGFLEPVHDLELRLFAMNALMDQFLANDDHKGFIALVNQIQKDNYFRYNLSINLRLINAGAYFEEKERYLEAGLLYSIVLPDSVLLNAVETKLIKLEEQIFRRQFIASKEKELLIERNHLRARRAEIANSPEYTANLRWRQARVLQLMGRSHEAYFGFLRLISEYPKHDHIEQFRYTAFLQALECGYLSEAVTQGEAYLKTPYFFLYEKPIAVRLAKIYERKENVKSLSILADNFLHRFPYEPIASQISHSFGNVLFRKGQTELILEIFPDWAQMYPDGSFIDSVHYWSGMAYLLNGEFTSALESFDALIESSPGSIYFKEACFRRGVAFFGLANYSNAREIFSKWVENSTTHPLLAEAHVFLGDLDAMDAAVDNAILNYEMVEKLGGTQALIDHAYFESASLYLANKLYAQHTLLLERYLDRYPNSTSGARAIILLAMSKKDQGDIASCFKYFRDGITRFGNDLNHDYVDQIIDAWWEIDNKIRASYKFSSIFVKRILEDADFRHQMLYDRVEQINYFAQNSAIPDEIQTIFNFRHPMYKELIRYTPRGGEGSSNLKLEDLKFLSDCLSRIREQAEQLPNYTPADFFERMRVEAISGGEDKLAIRLLRVLNLRAGREVSSSEIGYDNLGVASPATIVWIARIRAGEDLTEAQMILREMIEKYPMSEAIPEALHLLATLNMEIGYFSESVEIYDRILNEYFTSSYASDAAINKAHALYMSRRYNDAVQAYSMILNQREWRGKLWAEATYKIGLCFVEMNELGKAQGFLERTYLAYSGYPEWSGKAVLESAKLLLSNGEKESARKTYSFFLNNTKYSNSEIYQEIEEKINSL